MGIEIVQGQKITGRWGEWYRHDTVVVDGKKLEGFIQVRRKYFGKRIGHRMETITCFRGVCVQGYNVKWLVSVQGDQRFGARHRRGGALVKKMKDGWYYRRGSGPAFPWEGPFVTKHVATQVREHKTGGAWGYGSRRVTRNSRGRFTRAR